MVVAIGTHANAGNDAFEMMAGFSACTYCLAPYLNEGIMKADVRRCRIRSVSLTPPV
jgi:hypothetical protein